MKERSKGKARTVAEGSGRHSVEKGRAQQGVRASCFILWKIKFTQNTVKRKMSQPLVKQAF